MNLRDHDGDLWGFVIMYEACRGLWILSSDLQSVTQISVHQEVFQLVQPDWCWQSWKEDCDLCEASVWAFIFHTNWDKSVKSWPRFEGLNDLNKEHKLDLFLLKNYTNDIFLKDKSKK